MKLPAISLWQPWAALVASGVKRFETRSWSTDHRGALAIHAAKTRQGWEHAAPDVLEALRLSTYPDPKYRPPAPRQDDFAYGAVVATVELVSVIPIDELAGDVWQVAGSLDVALGDWSAGRYAWELICPEHVQPPVPVNGRQRLFPVEIDLGGRDWTSRT